MCSIVMAFEGLAEKLSSVFKKLKSKGKLSEDDVKETAREIRLVLLEADVNYKVVKDFVSKVSGRAVGQDVMKSLTPAQMVIKIVNEELVTLMSSENSKLNSFKKNPGIIMLCGLQGSGKTTFAGKLANKLKFSDHRPLLVACDIYRPAAIKQLQVLGNSVCVDVFEDGTNSPVEIARKAVAYAKDNGNDIVILDTAGRLHIDSSLMGELKLIKSKVLPDEILLAVDAMTGQDAVNVASEFNKELDITGVVLTKLDGDTKGGAAISVKAVVDRPIKFVSCGEKLTDIEDFVPKSMAARILGMGDVLGLIEQAKRAAEEEEEDDEDLCLKGRFDLNDYYKHLKKFGKFDAIQSAMSKIPGLGKLSKKIGDFSEEGELCFKKFMAIICSMTPEERSKPEIVNASRRRRLALGSGNKVEDVNRLLKTFEQTRTIFKKFGIGSSGGKGSLLLGKGGFASKFKKMIRF